MRESIFLTTGSLQPGDIHTESNHLFPVFLKLENLSLLIVGGGYLGMEKLTAVLRNSPGANIHIVASHISDDIRHLVAHNEKIQLIERPYQKGDIDGADIVIVAVNDISLNEQVSRDAQEKGKLVNAPANPGLSNFNLGQIVQKGSFKIAISANGLPSPGANRLGDWKGEMVYDAVKHALNKVHSMRRSIHGSIDENAQQYGELTRELNARNDDIEEAGVAEEPVTEETERPAQRHWKKIATYSAAAFAFMLIGHFIFSYIPLGDLTGQAVGFYQTLDDNFHWMVLAGFLAQMVDGALGMGYGVTSAAILLSTGINPAAISGSIHTAEMFASGTSGYSHYKFGNVNKKLFKVLVIPGVIGAIGGAILLVFLGEQFSDYIRPVLATYTLFLGVKIMLNAFRKINTPKKFKRYGALAGLGGFLDSFGGGGWGPIVTTTLITKGRSPRFVIGTVSLTEFFVTLASAFTFFTLLGVSHWQTIVALILGGFLAAPLAAKLTGKLPRKASFILLGLLVIIWSLKILSKLL